MKWPTMYLTVWVVLSTFLLIRGKRLLKREELIDSPYGGKGYDGFWVSDTQVAYIDKNTSLMVTLDVITKEKGIYGDGNYSNFYQKVWDVFTFSDDGKWVLIPHDCQRKISYSHSYYCNTTIIDRVTRIHHHVADGNYTQLVRMAPKTNAVVYVMDNDIYYLESPTCTDAVRLTTTGKPGVIFNGVCDWVYEDEIYQKARAFYFSTDGTKLVYLSLNDFNVSVAHYPEYGYKSSTATYQYVKDRTIRIPKAGTPIPKASVHVIDLVTKKEIVIDGLQAPVDLVTEDNIVVQLTFADEKNVVAAWTNRIQNIVVTVMCDVTTLKCQKVLETKQPDGWIDYPTYFFKNSTFFAIVLPQPQGSAGTYQHLTVVSNGIQKALTSGLRVVDSIVDYDVKRSLIYYLATNLTNPESNHLYVVPDDGSAPEKCLSCNICGTVTVELSINKSNYMLTCKGPGLGAVYVYSNTGTFIMELMNNTETEKKLQEIILPDVYNFEMSLADGVSKGSVRFIMPPGIDVKKKYPLLLHYGFLAPDTMSNTDVYNPPDFDSYLATAMNIIVAQFDVRGSSRRGDKYKFANYKKLGGVDVDDYFFLTKELMKKYSYIDSQRIGVYGFGYGGFISSMILARDTDKIFTCGIATSPVSNFIYRDAFIAEQYLALPEDNVEGYNYTDLTQLYEKFRGKKFLLFGSTHGTFNMYQQTAALARSLQMHNVPFQFQSLIDENVPDLGWMTKNTAYCYYNSVMIFLSRSFGLSLPWNGTST
ncbi:hypothetical protein LSTR_LSTR006399 [Laodelphax striatellus]|uniref:Peptidase S9 prolyl oligopeptidase catalytic domain-containing protein n=1 Tax=Laodelphax striatellus TaxID=195883 RepID=A0A482WY77_LAOST|nr:hypothetical protein LSTR_LSTR006399 [Laodelphax striatellus]